ncbi:zinc-binding dehydrogenase [Ilumatobacter nonamiensis]|uniref:zinc-binding dehydrogenase n=1 Tax=Ilumatobacter nonamiensis TaxID=467093 RepID=UPI00058BE4A7|nr:zinc-binding dehydrogenase [Ilumatobacter nonamiensis]
MRAAQYTEHGGPEVLSIVDLPDPEPGPTDVVVAVEACALNRLDVVQRNGWFTLDGFSLPHVAGMDVAGTVVSAGVDSDASQVAVGDRVVVDPSLVGVDPRSKLAGRGDLHGELGVIGANADGGYAELCLAPASHVYRVPDTLPIEHASTFPTCHLTASHALFDVARLSAGETVMIHAAGSGVSVAAIQLAKRAGATVLATAGSQSKLDRALDLGADHVVNNRVGDLAAWAREITDGRGVDVVFDHVGTALFAPSIFSLAVGGRLVSCGNTSGDEAVIPSLGYLFHNRIAVLGSDAYRPDEFGPAWDTFCTGDFAVHIEQEYPLDEAGAAQEHLASGDVFGKIVLRPRES